MIRKARVSKLRHGESPWAGGSRPLRLLSDPPSSSTVATILNIQLVVMIKRGQILDRREVMDMAVVTMSSTVFLFVLLMLMAGTSGCREEVRGEEIEAVHGRASRGISAADGGGENRVKKKKKKKKVLQSDDTYIHINL